MRGCRPFDRRYDHRKPRSTGCEVNQNVVIAVAAHRADDTGGFDPLTVFHSREKPLDICPFAARQRRTADDSHRGPDNLRREIARIGGALDLDQISRVKIGGLLGIDVHAA